MHTAPLPAAPPSADPRLPAAVDFVERVFPAPRSFAVRFWEGTVLSAAGEGAVTLAIRTPGALRRMFRLPLEPALGEAYLAGDFDLEGDLWEIGPALAAARAVALSPAAALGLARAWRGLPRGERGGRGAGGAAGGAGAFA